MYSIEYGTEDHVISLALEITSSAAFITERSAASLGFMGTKEQRRC